MTRRTLAPTPGARRGIRCVDDGYSMMARAIVAGAAIDAARGCGQCAAFLEQRGLQLGELADMDMRPVHRALAAYRDGAAVGLQLARERGEP